MNEISSDSRKIKENNCYISKMEKIQIAKRYLIIIAIAFSSILALSIIATYFGKSCSTELSDQQLLRQCKPYLCRNPDFFQG